MDIIWKRLFICLLLFVIIAVIAFAISVNVFNQQGIHIWGSYVHVDISRKCYFIDSTETIVGDSVLHIEGYLFDDFTGIINLEQYPMTLETVLNEISGSYHGRNHITFSGHGLTLTEDWERYYYVDVYKGNPDVIVIDIFQKDGTHIRAVCGDSEEDAIANYRTYLKKSSK